MKTNQKLDLLLKLSSYARSFATFFSLAIAVLFVGQSLAHAEASRSRVNASDASSSESWNEEESFPRRFIQWPRVTIGLVWSDPTSGQMKVMDLGSAPEDGQFTPDVLMSRCMRAAGRLSPEGRLSDAFSGTSTRTLQPLTDAEIEALLHDHSSRK